MRRSLLLVPVLLLSLAACGGGGDDDAAEPPTTTSAAAPSTPRPDDAQAAALATKAQAILPGLTPERAVDRSRNTCTAILQGRDTEALVPTTQQRFSGGVTGEVSAEQARRLIDLVKAEPWCKAG